MVLLPLHALRTRKQQRKMHVVQCGPSKGEMRLPADQRLPFKAATRPPLLPQPAHSSPTGVRERREKARESAREARAPSRTRAEKQLPPRWPAPPSPSPSQDPQSRRGFVAGAATTAARGCRFRGRQFSPCCCCCCCESRDSILRALLAWRRPAGRPSRGQGARIASERVSYFLAPIIVPSPPRRFSVCLSLQSGALFDAVLAATARAESLDLFALFVAVGTVQVLRDLCSSSSRSVRSIL